MTENTPQHRRISPEEAARLAMAELLELDPGIRELHFANTTLESLEAEYREWVEEFGPNEVRIAGETYTIWPDDNREESK